jgi:hypothetical protein
VAKDSVLVQLPTLFLSLSPVSFILLCLIYCQHAILIGVIIASYHHKQYAGLNFNHPSHRVRILLLAAEFLFV